MTRTTGLGARETTKGSGSQDAAIPTALTLGRIDIRAPSKTNPSSKRREWDGRTLCFGKGCGETKILKTTDLLKRKVTKNE